MSRDFAGEMRALVDRATAGVAYSTPLIARDLVARLRVEDPELLNGWLHAQAEHAVWVMINERDRSLRTRARVTSSRRAFADDAAEFEKTGDTEKLTRWLEVPFAVEDGTRKRLADMESGDLAFVATAYAQRARENALMGAFLRALANKIGAGTVKDHFSDAQLSAMWRSISD